MPFQFRLRTLFLLFVVLWSSLATFDLWGIGVFVLVVWLAIGIARSWWIVVGLVCLLMVTAAADLLSALCARESSRYPSCANNLHCCALGLHAYCQANGTFPPAYLVDKSGRPAHSWRVLILPYIGRKDLYQQYDFNEPWDGPHNKRLLGLRPFFYACPSDPDSGPSTASRTSYVAVVGADAAWSGDRPKKLDDLDPVSKTVLLVEVAGADIPWTAPRDVELPNSLGMITGKHTPESNFFFHTPEAGIIVSLADGSQQFLPGESLTPRELPKLLKIGGFREEYMADNGKLINRRIHWPHCIALAVWLASVAWLLTLAVRSRRAANRTAPSDAVSV
jgi:hypothetical protein